MHKILSTLFAAALIFLTPADASQLSALQITAPNGQISILMGSMHLGFPGTVLPQASIFDNASVYVIEHTTYDEKNEPTLAPEVLFGIAARMDVVANWAKPLSDAQIDYLLAKLNCLSPRKVTKEDFRMTLKVVSPRNTAQLAWIPCVAERLKSRDEWLGELAEMHTVPVVALETQDEVGPRRRAVPDKLYEKSLKAALDVDLLSGYAEIVSAINRGDYDAVLAATRIASFSEQEAALYDQIMVSGRNRLWIPRLIPILNRGRAVILVGAAHLAGEDGIIVQLRLKGYQVDTITLDGIRSNGIN